MHPTELVVDLAAIARNVEVMRQRGGGRKIIAAVKADAYGHGLVPVATHIEPLIAGFGVASIEEGVQLRRAGVRKTILKLSPAGVDELADALHAELSLVVGSLGSIDEIARAARSLGRRASVHLKVDTGMHRVGVAPNNVAEAAARIRACPELELVGVMTHFAVADVESGREFTQLQLRRFKQAVAAVGGALPWVHSGNSAGILNHDLSGDTAIRPGIALYGSVPEMNLNEAGLLSPVATWTSKVTLIKRLEAGEGLSYGLTWAPTERTFIATVAVGYGDGFSRLNSSRGRVLIKGRSYPVVGRVCMDQILVDVGPDPVVHEGDAVVLMGASGDERITPQEIADRMGTIAYEVTCLIKGRVVRRYLR